MDLDFFKIHPGAEELGGLKIKKKLHHVCSVHGMSCFSTYCMDSNAIYNCHWMLINFCILLKL